jgi:hypothetical protein
LFDHAKDLFGEAKLLDHGNANHRRTKSAANDISGEFDQMREVPFVREADKLALATNVTSHLPNPSPCRA